MLVVTVNQHPSDNLQNSAAKFVTKSIAVTPLLILFLIANEPGGEIDDAAAHKAVCTRGLVRAVGRKNFDS